MNFQVHYIFPTLQLLTCLGAAIVYAYKGQWWDFTYWLAAATITGVVTYR